MILGSWKRKKFKHKDRIFLYSCWCTVVALIQGRAYSWCFSCTVPACEVFGCAACGQSGRRLRRLICCGCGDALLSCQVEHLKEELAHSQSEKEELRQRANELQREVSAVRDTALCSFFLSPSFCLPG